MTNGMKIEKIKLAQILARREARVSRRKELLEKYKRPVVCLCMNIPGDIKRTPAVDLLFESGARRMLCAVLSGESNLGASLLHVEYYYGVTGPEGLFVFAGLSARRLKEIAVRIEDGAPEGRLFDLDIIEESGKKLSRSFPRACIVCGKPANLCASSRAHGTEQLKDATKELIAIWLADNLAAAAVAAMDEEAGLTPKPGLVDAANSGAHSDMDLALLKKSSAAMEPYFRKIACASYLREAPLAELTRIAIEAEAAMLEASAGVNTHRGAIFTFSIYIAALARAASSGEGAFEIAKSLAEEKAQEASSGTILEAAAEASYYETASVSTRESHGRIVKRKYGSGGALEHARQGFPTALKARRTIIETGNRLLALCGIMRELSDSNLLYRGGEQGLQWVQEKASEIEKMRPEDRISALSEMDEECIKRNLSPGGAADMLALAIFLSGFSDALLQEGS